MYVNDLLLVDLVEIPRGSVRIGWCYSSIYRVCDMSCFASIFLSRAFRNLKKTLESQAIENLLELWQKKKNEEVFPHN